MRNWTSLSPMAPAGPETSKTVATKVESPHSHSEALSSPRRTWSQA